MALQKQKHGGACQRHQDTMPAPAEKAMHSARGQGKTADPGFIAHWSYPVGLTKEQRWLAYYVSLSRPRAFANMLSHGLPEREIIESGPPEGIMKAFDEFFKEKIAATKRACVDARAAMGWPPRGTTSR